MNDIQSWWEVPSIAHFCSLFRTAFNLLDFDIEDLEEALLTDGTEETSWLQELIVRLLTGCLPNNEISTFNYQMFLRRLFREKCKEHDRYNPFNTDIDFQLLPLRTKVDILHALCDFRLDAEDVLEQLKNLEADSLRVEPLGYDNNDSAYWYFYGTRLYREDFKTKNNKKGKSVWQVVCFTEEDWFQLAKKFKKSQSKSERQLYRTLTENFLPELPRLFCEKERLARKRLLENQPRRTSSRLGTKRKQEIEQAEKAKLDTVVENITEAEEESKKKKELERRRQEAYERRARLREKEEDRDSEEKSESRYEMAGNKKREKKSKIKQRENSNSSSSSRDRGSRTRSSSRSVNRSSTRNADKTSTSTSSTRASKVSSSTTVGRQTNNSLASATGQIVIQPVSNPHRKKLKTSQVFRQTEEDLQTGMHKILDYVKNHEDAWPFVDPVEEEYAPNYYSIIRKPMDLQRMEERLDSGDYKSFSRFRGDFQLIVDNCRLYNGVDNEYTEMVGNLLTVFEKATERYLDQVTSSDEEIAVEFPETSETEEKVTSGKQKKSNASNSSPRKPTLAAQTGKKREPSVSEDSTSKRSNSIESFEQIKSERKQSKAKHVEESKPQKKNAKQPTKTEEKPGKKKTQKNAKTGKRSTKYEPSPTRSKSRSRSSSSISHGDWSSSPPPSWPPSSPDSRLDSPKRKNTKSSHFSDEESRSKFKGRGKQKDKWKDIVKNDYVEKRSDRKNSKNKDRSPSPPKLKDKHNKLRETIEKLKAKSELSSKLKDDDNDSDNDKTKENRDSSRELCDNKNKKHDSHKNKFKHKAKGSKNEKRSLEFDDENSTTDSIQSENKKQVKKESTKNSTGKTSMEALTLATEQTLKDINKWLDETPRLSEFSSASNSPSHYIGAEEFDSIGSKIEQDYRKKLEKPLPRKDAMGKDIKRRTFHRDPAKFLKKREVQRTIDRLQPGKSKGNLLSNVQNTNKVDELFPLGPLSKIKDTKNSLIVKTDESTPKLSLGSVLDSFGKHKFVDDVKKEEESDKISSAKKETSSDPFSTKLGGSEIAKSETAKYVQSGDKKEKDISKSPIVETGPGKATPNLSAWFKAFGAPKVPPNQKKSETKTETKETEKAEEVSAKQQTSQEQKPKEDSRKVTPPDISPNPDSPATPQGQPAPRQRKMSTGSTVSERSSFSQDMDSPRVGIDERLGAYPAPYPSPLHRSPSGASPIMASPRPDVSPKSAYPTVNGQIRVGFYQDTVSTKSSPEKSCSPRENPQSPYPQYSEHVYTPSTTESSSYSYNNPAYYSQMSNYSNPTTPSYNPEQTNAPSYYDTNKPLTDQYQAKTAPGYHSVNSPNFQNVNSPSYSANSPSYHSASANSPGYPTNSPASNVTQLPSPAAQQPSTYDSFRQQQTTRLPEKQQTTTMFPVKKRAYNESDTPQLPNTNQQQEQQNLYDRNYEMSLLSGRQLTIASTGNTPNQPPQAPAEVRPSSRSTPQQYVHQNIPNPRASNSQNQNPTPTNNVPQAVQPNNAGRDSAGTLQQTNQESIRNVSNFATPSNIYNYSSETGYPVNPAERPLDLNARPEGDKKMDMSKYTNMGYTGSDMGFTRNPPQYNRVDLNYSRAAVPPVANKPSELQAPTPVSVQNMQNSEMMMRYAEANNYRNTDMNAAAAAAAQKSSHIANLNMPQSVENRLNPTLDVSSGYKPEVSIPRPGYSTPSTLNMDQSLSLRGNLTNLSHIVDRFSTENMYYAEKGLAAPHIYSKSMVTSASSLPMFSQASIAMPYSHDMQATQSSMYSRQMSEIQNSMASQSKTAAFPQQQQQPEKKSKRRKNKAATTPTSSVETVVSSASNQGFQSYTGLKNTPTMEPSAIALKTAGVPGSAFNFGPAPTGLGISSAIYGDKDTYPNYLDDYRAAPNYYMVAAAAATHHRSTPETSDKQARTAHQPSASAAAPAGYPFIGTPQARPPNYPLSGPFIPPHQAGPLMDTSSPMFQQYLQAGVLHHQGLLAPPGYTGYHPALSMRQPFDSMTRPYF